MELNNMESTAKLEVDQLKNQLSHEETAAVILKNEAAEAKNSSPVSSGMAEEQAEMMNKSMSWMESVAQKQYNASEAV